MDESSWSQFMGHCKIHSQDQGLYAHYPTSQQGKTLSESFGICYCIPELPQRHFCPLMDVKLFLWRVDYTWGMSYSARLLMSLHQFWFKKASYSPLVTMLMRLSCKANHLLSPWNLNLEKVKEDLETFSIHFFLLGLIHPRRCSCSVTLWTLFQKICFFAQVTYSWFLLLTTKRS